MNLKKSFFGVFAGTFLSTTVLQTAQLLHFADIDGNEQSALASVDEFAALVGQLHSLSIQVTISFLVQGFMQQNNGQSET